MRRSTLPSLLLIAVLGIVTAVSAQNGPPPDGPGPRPDGQRMGPDGPPNGPPNGQRPPDRGALFRELGLSQEQFQQIRRMNQGRKPIMDAAHHRLNEANRLLDEAIYSDTLNEQEVQNRLKEAQAAQADMVKLRFTNELEIRKILTPEQLVKFRELREKFDRMRENKDRMEEGRPMRPNNQPIPQNGQPLRQVNRPGGQRPGF
jgi:Spy/CpxP family protein refolding chaperone